MTGTESKDTYQDLLNEAEIAIDTGNNANAEAILNQLVLKGFKKAPVFHLLGTLFVDQGKFNKAIRAFKRALDLDSQFTDAKIALSIVLNDLGRYEEGRKYFDQVQRKVNPNSEEKVLEKIATHFESVADLYSTIGGQKESLHFLKLAVKNSERKVDLYMKMINAMVKLDQTEEAVIVLKKVVREQKTFVPAKIRLGELLFQMDEVSEAISLWEDVLTLEPDNKQAEILIAKSQANLSSSAKLNVGPNQGVEIESI